MGNARESARLDGITVRRLWTPVHIANTPITPTLPWHLLTAPYDIVHAHLPTPWSADWPAFIGRIRRRPSVITYNNEIIGRGVAGGVAALYRGLLLPLTLAAASRIIVSTERYREISPPLRRQRDKTRVIPYGVDSERFAVGSGAAERGQTIFFLAVLDQFHSYKGLDDLLAAVAALRARLPGLRLVVGGAGSALAAYRAEAVRLGIAEITDFAGFITDEDLPRYYQDAAVFCLPSTSSVQEGFGLVLLEAMSCGTPVVTTGAVGMAPEIRDAAAGIVVPPRNPAELASALEAMLADPSRREEASRNARQLVLEKFTWSRVVDQTIDVYREIT
jgi:glycosyltransferase involved in cell wall biosynthesis